MVRRKSQKLKKSDTKTQEAESHSKANKTQTSQYSVKKKRHLINVISSDNNTQFVMNKSMYRQIRKLQLQTKLTIPKMPFCRVVREILLSYGAYDLKIQSHALLALQEAAEMYITQFFEDSYSCSLHAKRVTLQVKDMQLCRKIRGRSDIINK